MKKTSVLFYLVSFVFIICACNNANESTSVTLDSSDSIQPLPLKNVRHEICGVESYNSRAHQLCGVRTYNTARSAACGVASYNARQDMSCLGSLEPHSYENVTNASCSNRVIKEPSACDPGYNQVYLHEQKGTCNHRDFDIEIIVRKARGCDRPRHMETCRSPTFGVEAYNSCQHSSHGVETHNTCALPEFGVLQHNQCSFYLLPAEIDRFLVSVKELLPYMGETLVSSKAKYFLELDDEAAMACHIGKFETDPLFDAQMGELKTLYTVRFGRGYDTSRFDCSTTTTSDITQESCVESDSSRKCSSVRSYRGAKKWLDVKSNDLGNLKNDIAAKSSQAVASAVSDSINAINSYNK